MIFSVLIILGIFFSPMVVASFLGGNLIACLIIGLFFSVGGPSFDNTKKCFEDGLFGGKGSFAHKSAIITYTVGDPLKDTAGPIMSIQITT